MKLGVNRFVLFNRITSCSLRTFRSHIMAPAPKKGIYCKSFQLFLFPEKPRNRVKRNTLICLSWTRPGNLNIIVFHWIGPLGRFSHRVVMSVCVYVCPLWRRPFLSLERSSPQVTWPDPRHLIGPPLHIPWEGVMCHVSRVMCHMSHVTCHVSRKKNIYIL